MLSFTQFINLLNEEEKKPITFSELKNIENEIDKIFKVLNIDVSFTKHFLERMNDKRNGKPITKNELILLFKKEKDINGEKIKNIPINTQAILTDLNSNINIPFKLEWDSKNKEIDLVAKTIMRKKNFKSSDPILSV